MADLPHKDFVPGLLRDLAGTDVYQNHPHTIAEYATDADLLQDLATNPQRFTASHVGGWLYSAEGDGSYWRITTANGATAEALKVLTLGETPIIQASGPSYVIPSSQLSERGRIGLKAQATAWTITAQGGEALDLDGATTIVIPPYGYAEVTANPLDLDGGGVPQSFIWLADRTQSANQSPQAVIGCTPNGLEVQFSGSGSNDPDGTVVAWDWNFGDGSPNVGGETPLHTYAAPGTYTVTLQVTDNLNATSTIVSKQITVSNAILEPSANINWYDVRRLYEAPFNLVDNKVLPIPDHLGNNSDWVPFGAGAELDKDTNGIGAVTANGTSALVRTDPAAPSPLSEYEWMHDPTTDFAIGLLYKSDPSHSSGTFYLFNTSFGNGNQGVNLRLVNGNFLLQVRSAAGEDSYSIIGVPTDGSWVDLLFQMDKTNNDLHVWLNGAFQSVNSNFNWTPAVGDHQYEGSFGGNQIGFVPSAWVGIREIRFAQELGNITQTNDSTAFLMNAYYTANGLKAA